MLGASETSVLGPIELGRIWQSIENLYGDVESDGRSISTLLSEISDARDSLQLAVDTLEKTKAAFRLPQILIERLLADYRTSRQQLHFAEKLAEALKKGSGESVATNEDVEKLIALAKIYRRYECSRGWKLAPKTQDTQFDQDFIDRALSKLPAAYEFDIQELMNAASGSASGQSAGPIPREIDLDSPGGPCVEGPFSRAVSLHGEQAATLLGRRLEARIDRFSYRRESRVHRPNSWLFQKRKVHGTHMRADSSSMVGANRSGRSGTFAFILAAPLLRPIRSIKGVSSSPATLESASLLQTLSRCTSLSSRGRRDSGSPRANHPPNRRVFPLSAPGSHC